MTDVQVFKLLLTLKNSHHLTNMMKLLQVHFLSKDVSYYKAVKLYYLVNDGNVSWHLTPSEQVTFSCFVWSSPGHAVRVLSPGREHCVVFLGKTLCSHSASLYPDV